VPLKEKENEKLPPHGLLEKELLSSLLQHPELAAEVWPGFHPENFTHEPYRKIAACMFSLFEQGIPAKAASLLSYFSSEVMHKIITSMATDSRFADAAAAFKTLKSCLRRKKALSWSEERERLIKSLRESVKREDISDKLRRVQELKKLEEELYRSGEGVNLDG